MPVFHRKIFNTWHVFARRKTWCFLTAFHHQSTTTSPSKNHFLHPTFLKNPRKNALHHANNFFSRYHKKTRA